MRRSKQRTTSLVRAPLRVVQRRNQTLLPAGAGSSGATAPSAPQRCLTFDLRAHGKNSRKGRVSGANFQRKVWQSTGSTTC